MSHPVFGIIAPHPPIMVPAVGRERADVTRASADAMHRAAALLASFQPETVVIMSPHSPGAADAFAVDTAPVTRGDLGQFAASQVALEYRTDTEFAHALLARLEAEGVAAIDRATLPRLDSGHLDHGVLVPMSFLDPEGRWPIVNISLSWLSYGLHSALGRAVRDTAQALGRRIAFVASGDCSHRLTRDAPAGYDPAGAVFDRALVEALESSDFAALSHLEPALVEAAGECGLRSFITLGAVAEPARTRVLAYEGPWGVGYLTAVVNEQAVTPETGAKGGAAGSDESEIVSLARAAIETYVSRGQVLDPPPLSDPGLPERAGVFVSLHRNDDLRGCIGTIGPTEPTLAREVVRNAIQAAVSDPRFPELSASELADLDVKVDVLHAPEACAFEDLDPGLYGVIVSRGMRRGLLLPDLEGVDTAQCQVDIARRKGGIGPGESCDLERFRVDRYT